MADKENNHLELESEVLNEIHKDESHESKQDEDYEVGYGKPPKEWQFQKGASGNPAGRPKGRKNLKTIFQEIHHEMISVRVGNETQKMTRGEAVIRQLVKSALSGTDLPATKVYLHYASQNDDDPVSNQSREQDRQSMESLLRRLKGFRNETDSGEGE